VIKSLKTPKPHWMNQTTLRESLGGISHQAFHLWKVKPVAMIGREKYYTMEAVLQNRLAHHTIKSEKLISRKEAMEKLDGAKLEEVQERTMNMALKNAVLKREHAPIAMLEWIVGQLGAQVSSILESIPVKVMRRCPHLKKAELQIITEEIVKCQNIASEVHVDLDEYESGQ